MAGHRAVPVDAEALLAQVLNLRTGANLKQRFVIDIIEALGQLGTQLDVELLDWAGTSSEKKHQSAGNSLLVERLNSLRQEFGVLLEYCAALVRTLHTVCTTMDGRGTVEERFSAILQQLQEAMPVHASRLDDCIAIGRENALHAQELVDPGRGRRRAPPAPAAPDDGGGGRRAAAPSGGGAGPEEGGGRPPAPEPRPSGSGGAGGPSRGGAEPERAGGAEGSGAAGRGAPAARGAAPAAARPPPRFPELLLRAPRGAAGGLAELGGPGGAAEARRLAAASRPFLWRRSGLVPARPWSPAELPAALQEPALDTNLSPRADRRFVYFSPSRLEKGAYEPGAVARDFMPMRLNEQMSLREVRKRHAAQATDLHHRPSDAGSSGSQSGVGQRQGLSSGWTQPQAAAEGTESPYVMQVLLEGLSPEEADKASRLPQGMRPPMARIHGLQEEPFVIWRPDLAPLASVIARDLDWARLGDIAQGGGWGPFETAGFMVSGRDALTPLHYDKHHNVFMQLYGAKRVLLFEAEESSKLYGFPTLHALDPLSRVDLEASLEELRARWPRVMEAQGLAVTLEAGDVLVLPQGTWHHVHSLEPENVSMNFLFSLGAGEACGREGLGVRVGALPPARRPAALAELAKTAEGLLGGLDGAGGARAALALASARAWPRGAAALRELLQERLGDGRGGPPVMAPEDFARLYLDPRRFRGLPLRAAPG